MRSNNSLRRNGKYRRSMRQILGFNFYDVFVFLFCIVFALVCVYPMWYVLVASVTPHEEYIKGGLMLWPTGGVDLQYYKAIFSTKSFTNSMWISVSKTVIATVLSVLVTASMAYGVSKVHVKGSEGHQRAGCVQPVLYGRPDPSVYPLSEPGASAQLLGHGSFPER